MSCPKMYNKSKLIISVIAFVIRVSQWHVFVLSYRLLAHNACGMATQVVSQIFWNVKVYLKTEIIEPCFCKPNESYQKNLLIRILYYFHECLKRKH